MPGPGDSSETGPDMSGHEANLAELITLLEPTS